MAKKYEMLTEDTIEHLGRKLYRIRRLEDGELGGYIESEDNLSQAGGCWVGGNAWVCGGAEVSENAWVSGYARVCGDAKVYGDAEVFGNAEVYGNAEVFGDAVVSGYAGVYGNARVYGDAEVACRVFTMIGPRDSLTFLSDRISIGCESHSYEHWLANYRELGKKHGYSDAEIKLYGQLIISMHNYMVTKKGD